MIIAATVGTFFTFEIEQNGSENYPQSSRFWGLEQKKPAVKSRLD